MYVFLVNMLHCTKKVGIYNVGAEKPVCMYSKQEATMLTCPRTLRTGVLLYIYVLFYLLMLLSIKQSAGSWQTLDQLFLEDSEPSLYVKMCYKIGVIYFILYFISMFSSAPLYTVSLWQMSLKLSKPVMLKLLDLIHYFVDQLRIAVGANV